MQHDALFWAAPVNAQQHSDVLSDAHLLATHGDEPAKPEHLSLGTLHAGELPLEHRMQDALMRMQLIFDMRERMQDAVKDAGCSHEKAGNIKE